MSPASPIRHEDRGRGAGTGLRICQRICGCDPETSSALTLRRAMLTDLTQHDQLALFARYRPADSDEEVGGDWYDAVLTPSGSTYLMIGDVAGHDIDAAACMGQLRSMVRMAAWLASTDPGGTPAGVLERVDRACHDLGVDTLASTVLARIEQHPGDAARGTRDLHWTNAGHPPPVLVEPGRPARLLCGPDGNDAIIGLDSSRQRREHVVPVPDGSRVLLYTDGLVERRHEVLDVALDRLLASVDRHARRDPEAFLDHLLGELVTGRQQDDVAVLVVDFG